MKRPATPPLPAPLPPGARVIGWLQICNIDVPVIRASSANCAALRDEADGGAPLDGRFCAETGSIFVRVGLSPSLERDAINHEILHALLSYSGARSFLAGTLKADVDDEDAEETLVRILAPHIAGIGWAQ